MASNKVNNFSLKSIKIRSDQGLEVKYTHQVKPKKGVAYTKEEHPKSPMVPHEDFMELLNQLPRYVAKTQQAHRFLELLDSDTVEPKEKKALEVVSDLMIGLADDINSNIHLNGLHISGTEEKPNVILTSTSKYNKSGSALNSPMIRLGVDIWGWEQELLEIIENIKEEAIAYVFDLKHSTEGLLFGDEEKKKEPAKEEV